jgi:hypothetical protein
MHKQIPVWVFLLCLLVGALGTVGFGWSVKGSLAGTHTFHGLGKVAVAIASFPDTVKLVFTTVKEDPDVNMRVPRTNADVSAFKPIATRPGIDIKGLVVHANHHALERARGWRILVGGFMLNGEFTHAALALSPELEVVRAWKLSEEGVAGVEPRVSYQKYVHGFALLPDGSVIFSFIPGVTLQRVDACSRRVWATPGSFHHAVSLANDKNFVWSLRDEPVNEKEVTETLVRVAVATGEVVKRISVDDIVAANPTIDILQIKQDDDNWGNGNPRNKPEVWGYDPLHLNDVEELPAAYAGSFNGFVAGDLLVSVRNLNLIFVLDPETLKVKWWHSGSWRRQHDPDWEPNGTISLLDNRMSRDYSRIVRITPFSDQVEVAFDGRTNDFYTRIRGNHQFTPAGNLLVASTQQGRAFEVDRDGQPVLEVYSTRPGGDEYNYPLSDAQWLALDSVDLEKDYACGK